MTKIEGFIFDIDGTIASTNELIFATFNFVAKKYLNTKLSNQEIINLFGPTEDVILKQWMNNNYEAARKDYYEFYQSNHQKMADAYPGIEGVLIKIKSAGKPLGIYTGKGRKSSEITLEEIGLSKYFDLIVTGDDVPEPKPSRLGIQPFIDKFNLDPENVVMIGDSTADIKAAKSGGVKSVSVVWDSYSKNEVINTQQDFLFYTVDELDKFITEIL